MTDVGTHKMKTPNNLAFNANIISQVAVVHPTSSVGLLIPTGLIESWYSSSGRSPTRDEVGPLVTAFGTFIHASEFFRRFTSTSNF